MALRRAAIDSLAIQKEHTLKVGNFRVLSTDTNGNPLGIIQVSRLQVLHPPPAPTVVVHGTAGVTTYVYRIYADDATGSTEFSAEGQIATGNAVLTGVNFNRVTWDVVPAATSYTIVRTTGGTAAIITAGLTSPTYDDVDNTAGTPFLFDSRYLDVSAANTTGVSARAQLYVQSITLSITTHAAGVPVAVQSADGTILAEHTDAAAGANVPSVLRWEFGPHGTALVVNNSLGVLVDDAVGGIVAYIHVEAYERFV